MVALKNDKRTALLILVCLAQFMVILDVSIVNVALPSIHDGLDFSDTGLQWVVNAYTLTFAGFLLLGGRAADLLGRKRVFIGGTALFAVASLACALASSQGMLLGARALQGLGGAVISPASLAIITTSFAEGGERNRALGIWSAMAGLGGTSGVLFGGVLTQGFDWPAIFIVNIPIAIAVIMFSRSMIPADREEASRHSHFDVAGAVTVTAGLTAIVYGVVRTDVLGWGSAEVLIALGAGVALLASFALIEGKFAREPLMPLHIFSLPALRGANLVIFLLGSALFAMWFFISLYLQQVLGHDALETGLDFLPMTLTIVAASTLAPKLIARFGVRPVLAAGMTLAAAGLALLSGLTATGTYADHVLPGGILAAAGLGTSMVPVTIAAVQGVPGSQSGLASGLINTSRLVGGALGLAALTTLAASHTSSQVASGVSALSAQTDGYSVAFIAGAIACFAGAVLTVLLIKDPAVARAETGELEIEPA